MPYEERGELLPFAKKYGVDIISLIAPTSSQRIKMIAKEADGYIYLVSSMGVTGVRGEITTDIAGIVQSIRGVTDTPVAVGFGINTPKQAAEYSGIADGVIVGSAIVKIIAEHGGNAGSYIYDYVSEMVNAL